MEAKGEAKAGPGRATMDNVKTVRFGAQQLDATSAGGSAPRPGPHGRSRSEPPGTGAAAMAGGARLYGGGGDTSAFAATAPRPMGDSMFAFTSDELNGFDLAPRTKKRGPSAAQKRAAAARKAAAAAAPASDEAPEAPALSSTGGGLMAARAKTLDGGSAPGAMSLARRMLVPQETKEAEAKPEYDELEAEGGGEPAGPPSPSGEGAPLDASAGKTAAMAGGSGDVQDSDLEAIEMSRQLRTGEDAIAFFARYGGSCPVKFVHLNRAETGDRFRPYDLVVVPQSDTTPEYFTMSAKGVVHISPRQPSEFVPLSDWMRASTIFNVLTSMRFFKYYLTSKMFRTWRSNVRYNLYCQQRAKLSRQLFLAKPSFCGPLLEINKLLADMHTVPTEIKLLDLRSQKTFEITQFTDAQAAARTEATKRFEAVVEKIQAVVERVCADVTKRARQTDDGDGKDGRGGKADKSKSMLAIKQEQARRQRALRRAAQEEAMLGEFVRLVDYMEVESLVKLTVRTAATFLEELLDPPTMHKTGFFETTVQFGDDMQIEFSPACEQFQNMVAQVCEAMITTVNNAPRVLYMRPFKAYVSGLVTDAPSTQLLVRDSPEYQLILSRIADKLAADFHEANVYAQTFENVRPIAEFQKNDEIHKLTEGATSVQHIKVYIAKIETWDKELEKMRVQNVTGILHVESRKLKQNLLPVTSSALEAMKTLMQAMASDKCGDLLGTYEARIKVLDHRPMYLKEFANYVEKMNQLKADDKSLARDAVVVDEMYRVLNGYEDVKISSEDMVQVDDLRHNQAEYEKMSDRATTFVDDKMPEMTRTLDMNIIKLNEQLASVAAALNEGGYIDSQSDPAVILEELESVRQKLAQFDELSKTYNKWQTLFNIPQYEFKNLQVAQDAFKLRHTVWHGLNEFNSKKAQWFTDPLLSVDVEELSKDVQMLTKTAFVSHKKLDDSVTALFKDAISDFRHLVPTIMELGNPTIKPRHWEKLYKHLGQPYIPGNESFTLEELASYDVFEHKDVVSDISGTASGEAQLEASLDKIADGWAELDFVVKSYRESKNVFIIGGLDDVFTLLEDNQVTLQTMMGSRYIMGVKEDVESWDTRLRILADTLDEWVSVQRNWMYLETIFSAEDIQKQLPAEAAKFAQVDKMWKDTMRKTNADPKVINSIDDDEGNPSPARMGMFQRCNGLLEEIQKSLEDYLETKRSGFPRFYFLSNDELLAILSETRNVQAVQPHVGKCFDAMASITFGADEGSTDVCGMVSPESESVDFTTAVNAVGNVENWLCDVEAMMRRTLYDVHKDALIKYPPPEEATVRDDWFFEFCAQPVLTVDQVMWAQNCENAITAVGSGENADAIKDFYDYSLRQLASMVNLVRGSLTKLQRTTMGALVVIDVHARDVVAAMVKKQVASLNEFEWTRQLRYYWEEDIDNCVIRQTNTRFVYGYEYLGNQPRLVITPLTDKCYMTLTGALHLRFGGAPAGPAGTGKTETVKDLGKALARQCVVFNCSDGLDYKMMGRFFSGLAQCGAWACFDEFNRIDIEVLSVIAQQILCIQQGMSANASHIDFEGREIPLSLNFGVFITMNPGYAGRTELPDNLKALFRPVAMMVPDYRLIAEIILFSQGFNDALALSNKMVQLYKLASEQLSKQDHYDFGMRAVKSVLVAAGQLKRKEPDVDENLLLIRAMRDSNVPKFLEHDLPLFRGIVSDLFPGVEVPFVDYGKLQLAIENQLRLAGFQLVPSFITKIIQVHETQLVRHGMMVVGEAGSGKTTNTHTLAKAVSQLQDDGVVDKDSFFKHVERFILNPKAIRMGELYGEFDLLTSEWADGLVASLVRQAVADSSDKRKWIMFDGPVDALWIENMNTVLDDNKMLCLANGERIKVPAVCHIMFEVMDLAVASPATVSRCGMVYMEAVHVGLLPLVQTWAEGDMGDRIPDQIDRVVELLTDHLEPTMAFLEEECRQIVPAVGCQIVQSFMGMMDALLVPEKGVRCRQRQKKKPAKAQADGDGKGEDGEGKGEDGEGKGEDGGEGKDAEGGDADAAAEGGEGADGTTAEAAAVEDEFDFDDGPKEDTSLLTPEQLERCVNLAYVFSFMWAFGGNVDDQSRPKFNAFALKTLGRLVPDSAAGGNLYDFNIDLAKREMVPWASQVADFVFDIKMPYFNMVVPTVDTTRYSHILELVLSQGRGVLFTAETGVGKSVISQLTLDMLVAGDEAQYVTSTVNFSAQTTSANLQEVFETSLDKKRKNLLGPPSGKRMAMFVDDLNMPKLEVYGAQPPIELLRQVIDQGGFYDRKKLFFKNVADTLIVAACAPPGGGRNVVTPRLTRFFHQIWLTSLSDESLQRIFTAILGGFLNHELDTLADLAAPIVDASITMFHMVEDQMLPTPAKSHYTFNLRDLSKVFQGVLQITNKWCSDKRQLIDLWLHEEQRVFRDRLIDETDRGWFNDTCAQLVNDKLGVALEVEDFQDVLFGDYLSREEKVYRQVELPLPKLTELFDDYLEEYNVTFSNQMHLVFFKDALAHLSRICRILRQPRGNALLVGVGGSGRQSLTRLASFVAEYKCVSIEITRVYGSNEFHEDLKKMLMLAGVKCKDVVFLFSDTQIVKESFLEDINNILNAGDVPNLYAPDEMEAIINGVRPLVKAAGKIETRDNIYAHYIQLVREHLHIVLAFSPIGDAFRSRCRMFPSLVNCTTIDWFNAWPEDALYSVAHSFLSKGAAELGIDEVVDPLCRMCVKIHQGVELTSERYLEEQRRHNYTTPTSYLELIKLYTSMLREQRDIVSGKASRYRGGLQKLNETNVMVAKLEKDLTELQPVLKKASEDTASMLVQLAKDQKEADAAAEVAAKDEAETAVIANQVAAMKADCQADLDEALPAYYNALKALDSLDKKQIQEVKSFTNPPRMVGVVMEAVCVLLGRKTTWDEAKKLLNEMKFMEMLKGFDKDKIKAKIIRAVKPYYNNPEFVPENISKVSQAATSLCLWVRAIYKYDQVAKTIAPKKAKLAKAEDELAAAQKILFDKQAALKKVLDKVAELKASYEASLQKKEDLERQSAQTQTRLGRAHKLTDGLGDEAVRWEAAAAQLEVDLHNLIGNVVLCAGCIAYIGPFNAEYRKELASEWVRECKGLKIPVDPQFSLIRILADPVVVRDWNIMGLPADEFSTENGMFATMGRRWPLMIDPQGQANRWVKNLQKENNLQVIKLSDGDFLRTLENAIRFGQPVLLENVEEELDPALEPVLLKQTFKKGGQMLLHLGDSDIPYSDEFRLYITTKLPNPHYMPEVCIKVTVINFTVTMKGLEDQLLVDVVKFERPDLEKKKDQLIVSIANDKRQLKEVEDKILQMLAESSGDILEDEELINNLAASKRTSLAISGRMKEAEATTKEINEAREHYRPVATRGSVLYFVIADLATVDTMYQYSLPAFSRLYTMRIERSEKSDDLSKRIEILISDLTLSFYNNVCRGLFEIHKLLYSFMIAAQVMRVASDVSPVEWQLFMLGTARKDDGGRKPPSTLSWIAEKTWLGVLELDAVPAFAGLIETMSRDGGKWQEWAESKRPEMEAVPSPYDKTLNPFQQLMLIRTLREERTVFAVREFVGKKFGREFMEAPPFDLEGAYQDSTAATPLVFVLSPGADPIDYLLKLAKEKGKGGPSLKVISLGQGQGPRAEQLMEAARLSGDWVCLQNCHLAVSWLPRLEQILEQTSGTNEHEEYRLWLTSMPSPKFPVAVLQNSIKITQEPPRGLKANLKLTFQNLSEAEYEGCTKPRPFKKLLFGVAFYHALCLERRKFGAIGWNIPYEWMNSDLKTGIMQVQQYLEEQPGVPYETLNAVVGDITYGGRATDAWDKRTNLAILTIYFCEAAMDDAYRYSPSGIYYAPKEGSIEDLREYIAALPLDDAPETFGLHENADITLNLKQTSDLMKTIISMQPRASGGGGGKTPDEIVEEIAADVLAKLPDEFDKRTAHASTFMRTADGSVNSMGVFCEQEMVRFNKLIRVIRSSLNMLKKAIKGLVVMSSDLERMHQNFIFQLVPAQWENAAYPSLKPLASWVTDLFQRLAMIDNWLKNGPPTSYWISGFFFPQGFMTGALQTHSRKTKIAVDTLNFQTRVQKFGEDEVTEGPKNGVYIFGSYLEGARWDRDEEMIREMHPGELYCYMPVVWLEPVLIEEVVTEGRYNCPFYKTSRRAGTLSTTGHSTNFIVALHLPTDKPEDHWIRGGVALLSQLDT